MIVGEYKEYVHSAAVIGEDGTIEDLVEPEAE